MAEERKTVDAMLNEQKEQKSAKKNGAAPQKGKNASVESPKADKETEQEPLKLTRRQIFTLTTLLTYKYRFARILVNRDIDKEEVKKKIESIRAAKGVITPFLVLSAKECIEAGLAGGSEYFLIEQDATYGRDPFESLKISKANLEKLGYADWFNLD